MSKLANYEEWLSSSFWWTGNEGNLGHELARDRAAELHRAGVQQIWHVWKENLQQFLSAEEASERFGLGLAEYSKWESLQALIRYREATETTSPYVAQT